MHYHYYVDQQRLLADAAAHANGALSLEPVPAIEAELPP
jgi:hypothetical protein